MADVGREAERDEMHAEREEAWTSSAVGGQSGRSGSVAAAAPPGFGPGVVRTATARGLTLRTRPQLVQVSTDAWRPEPAHRADHRQRVVAIVAAQRPGRVDEGVAPAVGQPDREDRLAAGPDLGDARTLDEGDLHPRLA